MPNDRPQPGFLVDTAWLAANIGAPGLVILDATTHLLPRPDRPYDVVSGRADFEAGHISGARFADIDNDLSDPAQKPPLHFTLPPAGRFAAGVGALGVDNQSHLICYATANHWWATRLWWMFRAFGYHRVSVLDGGFQKWHAEGRQVETGPAAVPVPRHFDAAFHPELVVDRRSVLAAIGAEGICTVNALRPEQHRGEGGTRYGRPGHIAGSVNVPAVDLVAADNTFKPLDELRRLLAEPLAAPTVITYCGGGIAATSATLALTMLGHRDVRLYDASLSEWAPDPSLPMAT